MTLLLARGRRFQLGNRLLVSSVVLANLDRFPGGIFLDQMAILDTDLGPAGAYHDGQMTLLPWGMLYRAQARRRRRGRGHSSTHPPTGRTTSRWLAVDDARTLSHGAGSLTA